MTALLAAALIYSKLKYFRINKPNGEVLEINYMTDSYEWGFCYNGGEYASYSCDPEEMTKKVFRFMCDDCTLFLKENVSLPMSFLIERIKNTSNHLNDITQIPVKNINIYINDNMQIENASGTMSANSSSWKDSSGIRIIGVDTN